MPMKTFAEQITTYAAYHRDVRNVWTHFVGVPMIVFAVLLLLAMVPLFKVAEHTVTLAHALFLGGLAYYFLLDALMGLLMTLLVGALWWGAILIVGSQTWPTALGIGVGVFVVGWALQFWGHKFEGRKPAFVDDLNQLMIGPLFVTTEVLFALGLRRQLKRELEAKVGPARNGKGPLSQV
jgi:uncharacterized membrane protein YGL010W